MEVHKKISKALMTNHSKFQELLSWL